MDFLSKSYCANKRPHERTIKAMEVEIELETAPREVSVPDDFAEALDRYKEARQFFDSISYSNKRRFVLNIDSAKSAETRQIRIALPIKTFEVTE